MKFKLISLILLSLVTVLLISGCAQGIKLVESDGVSGDGLTPYKITKKVQKSLAKVRNTCVGINRSASGIIITPDGYVLTAGHVAAKFKDRKKPLLINLEDGRKAEADFIGWDKSNDMALLKIRDEGESWAYAELLDRVPENTSICFLYGHTAGYQKSRPAQLRLGRVRGRVKEDGITRYLFSDASVQPGDSGGGLFDIDGRLIGFCTTAGPIGVNRYTSIDSFLKSFERLRRGEVWGDAAKAKLDTTPRKIDSETKKLILLEFKKRVNDEYRPVMDAIMAKAVKTGTERVDFNFRDIHKNMGIDLPMLMDSRSLSYGIDDPVLISQLQKLPADTVLPLLILSDGKFITYGVPVTKSHLLVKNSELSKHKNIQLILKGKKKIPLHIDSVDKKWDLALLKVAGNTELAPLEWPEKSVEMKAGTGLVCPDSMGRLSWGIASDERRTIVKGGRKGPMLDKSRISSYRAPYPSVIRHTLPLYAKHAGTPVYTLNGDLVGIHMGRICRTLGLIVDIQDVKTSVDEMLKERK